MKRGRCLASPQPTQMRRHVTEEAILDILVPTDATQSKDKLSPPKYAQIAES